MSADVTLVTPHNPARQDRVFHTALAAAFLIVGVVGFGPTYFLKPIQPSPPLSPLLHTHGLLFTSWLVLLLVQSALVRAHRVDLHKRLGIAGAVLGAVMIPLGFMVAIEAARHGTHNADMGPLPFMVFPFGAVVMFAGFFGAALWQRRRPEIHRRLIVLATLSIITPAIARLPWIDHRSVVALLLSMLFVVAAMLHDWKSRGRVHHVYIWGGLIVLLSGPGRAALGNSAAWQSFARFLVE